MVEMIYEEMPCPDGVPEHLWGGVKRYILHGVRPGSWLRAFFEGDLYEVMARGDDEVIAGLKALTTVVVSRGPAGCRGSRERVDEWIVRGGLRGIEEEVA